MSKLTEESARIELLDLLLQCTDLQQEVFKRMYAPNGDVSYDLFSTVLHMTERKKHEPESEWEKRVNWAILQCKKTVVSNNPLPYAT